MEQGKAEEVSKNPITSDAEADHASAQVMHPELLVREVNFLGKAVKLRPLPISYSKRIWILMKPIRQETEKAMKEQEMGKLPDLNMDSDLTVLEAWVDCLMVLVEFYDLGFTKTDLEKLSLTEMDTILVAQLEVGGAADFLLRPLRIIIAGLRVLSKLDEELTAEASRPLTSLERPALQKPGESTPSP